MNVIVMDVEGTDGRERGEDQDFERKSALFSLASSEVLIINLWEHQVGLYQGANMGLLKTVFEVNLGLFGKAKNKTNERTLLLFVIRDHIGTTPLENLATTLQTDLNRIWESLSKPEGLEDCKLTDYFDLSFTALPHKVLAADKFESDVQTLRKRFVNKRADDYVFKPAYHKRIPADGVAMYMEGIWVRSVFLRFIAPLLKRVQEQVQSNKDLDLPTQQELLAQFRCDEIASVALAEFNEQAKTQRRPIEAGRIVEGLGGMMRSWKSAAICTSSLFSSLINSLCPVIKLVTTETLQDTTKVSMSGNVLTFLVSSTQFSRPYSLASSRISINQPFMLSRSRCKRACVLKGIILLMSYQRLNRSVKSVSLTQRKRQSWKIRIGFGKMSLVYCVRRWGP